MLSNLRIKNFRMLEDFEVPKLGRVNLIVGKNNCGKSSVLEALHLNAWRAHPELLQNILRRHSEFLGKSRSGTGGEDMFSWAAIENLFFGRKFPENDGQPILFESEGKILLHIEHQLYAEPMFPIFNTFGNSSTFATTPSSNLVFKKQLPNYAAPVYPRIKVSFGDVSSRIEWLDLLGEQARSFFFSRNSTWLQGSGLSFTNVGYVPTQLLAGEFLAGWWDQTLRTTNTGKKIIEQALQIIEPDVQEINFVQDTFEPAIRIPIVQLIDAPHPVPLASMGDGMLRVMQLILAVFQARNGVLLIDEFENGLHYSVQEKVWKLVFQLARDLDIQVFATTHSWDCIQSFTKVALDSPDDGILFKMSKSKLNSDNGKIIATVYDEDALKTVTASDLEVR